MALVAVAACRAEAPAEAPGAAAPTPATSAPPAAARPALIDPQQLAAKIQDGLGRVTVINFWATWCPPCIEEMPEFTRLHRDYRDKNVELVSVTVDSTETLDSGELERFIAAQGMPFPVHVLSPGDPDSVAQAVGFEFTGLPMTFVFGPDGKLAHSWQGPVTYAMLAEVVSPLVKSLPAA
jgi:thiol-disulfide isomerase/thioredoxin